MTCARYLLATYRRRQGTSAVVPWAGSGPLTLQAVGSLRGADAPRHPPEAAADDECATGQLSAMSAWLALVGYDGRSEPAGPYP